MLLIDLYLGIAIFVDKDMDPLFLKNPMVPAVEQRPKMSVRARIYKFLPRLSDRFVSKSPPALPNDNAARSEPFSLRQEKLCLRRSG